MPHPTLSSEEIAQRCESFYEEHIRTQVETTENIGKIIAINLSTGDYEIDQDLLAACHRLKAKQPDTVTWIQRIGYDAVYAVGGTLVRTAKCISGTVIGLQAHIGIILYPPGCAELEIECVVDRVLNGF